MPETKYLVNKSDYGASRVLKQVYKGRIDPNKVLFDREHDACKRIQRMPLGQQELYSVFKVSNFDKKRIVYE